MRIAILFNQDLDLLADDPGRAAREDVGRVTSEMGRALAAHGAEVLPVSAGRDLVGWVGELRSIRPDAVVNLCESLGGDNRGEVAVPTLLELLGLPYTGAPSLALALALNKDRTKEMLRGRGVPVPEAVVVERAEDLKRIDLPFPLIVKPCREDGSVGIDARSVVDSETALRRTVERVLHKFRQPVLVERFVAGHEIYVPFLGNEPRVALPLTQVQFGEYFAGRPNIVSYQAKWDPESLEWRNSPAGATTLPAEIQARCVEVGRTAFEAIGCRDYGRVDLRVTAEGQPFVIDVNPNCDLNPEAGFALAAARAGIAYDAVVMRVVELALARGPATAPEAGPRQARPAQASERPVRPRGRAAGA